MKLLLDNCVDHRLRNFLPGHEVIHARDMGWEALTNGRLLSIAESNGFDAIVTVDKNFRFQQMVEGRQISLVTLNSVLTRLSDLRPLVPRLLDTLTSITPATFITIDPT